MNVKQSIYRIVCVNILLDDYYRVTEFAIV